MKTKLMLWTGFRIYYNFVHNCPLPFYLVQPRPAQHTLANIHIQYIQNIHGLTKQVIIVTACLGSAK